MVGAGALGWRYQSELIGVATRWYLSRVAAKEDASGDLTQRRRVLAGYHRQLLMPPPEDARIPELFDFATALAAKMATGEVSIGWAAKLYTEYQREMVVHRPDGRPRRSPAEVEAALDGLMDFYAVRKRPGANGITAGDLLGAEGDDVITLEEIEAAYEEGREIDLKNRGAD